MLPFVTNTPAYSLRQEVAITKEDVGLIGIVAIILLLVILFGNF